MALRCYLADLVPCEAPRPGAIAYWPVVRELVPTLRWHRLDARRDASKPGRMLVWADVTNAQHATVAADARVTVLPFDGADGRPLPWATGTVGDLSAANRAALRDRLEALHIPLHGLTLDTPIRAVLQRVRRVLLIRSVLRSDDFSEGLETLVSTIPLAKRQRIATRLQAWGFDTTDIRGTDTIREALRRLAAQHSVSLFRST